MLSTWCRRVRAPAGDAAGPHQPRDRPRVRAQPLRQVDPQHLGVQEGSARTGDKLLLHLFISIDIITVYLMFQLDTEFPPLISSITELSHLMTVFNR